MNEQEWKELEAEFERGYQIFLQNSDKPCEIEGILRKQKVGKGKIKIDCALINSGLLGVSTKLYERRLKELEEKVDAFVAKEGLNKEATVSNGFYLSDGKERVAFAGNYCFAAKKPTVFRKLATEIYGY
jgi:hypothetical protein